jgi:hypothetical protein
MGRRAIVAPGRRQRFQSSPRIEYNSKTVGFLSIVAPQA